MVSFLRRISIAVPLLPSILVGTTAFSYQSPLPPPPADVTVDRRSALRDLLVGSIAGLSCCSSVGRPKPARAANLPQSTGADTSRTGTVDTLVPIVQIEQTLRRARQELIDAKATSGADALGEVMKSVAKILTTIPTDETLFKRIFDEYSDPVSYKQKFMDQNAFLVYYSRGFDGPNRPAMESGDVPKQTLQYGARNDVWTGLDDATAELAFYSASSSLDDVLRPLERAIVAMEAYLSYAPGPDVDEARKRLALGR